MSSSYATAAARATYRKQRDARWRAQADEVAAAAATRQRPASSAPDPAAHTLQARCADASGSAYRNAFGAAAEWGPPTLVEEPRPNDPTHHRFALELPLAQRQQAPVHQARPMGTTPYVSATQRQAHPYPQSAAPAPSRLRPSSAAVQHADVYPQPQAQWSVHQGSHGYGAAGGGHLSLAGDARGGVAGPGPPRGEGQGVALGSAGGQGAGVKWADTREAATVAQLLRANPPMGQQFVRRFVDARGNPTTVSSEERRLMESLKRLDVRAYTAVASWAHQQQQEQEGGMGEENLTPGRRTLEEDKLKASIAALDAQLGLLQVNTH